MGKVGTRTNDVIHDRPPSGRSPEGFFEIAPDVVVEVISPGDTARDVQRKIDDWLEVGTPVVWAIYLSSKMVFIHRGLDRIDRKTNDDDLDAEPVLPRFRCKVSELFSGV